MQISLLSNRGLQAAYNGLGIAEAAKVQAMFLPNPAFSFSPSIDHDQRAKTKCCGPKLGKEALTNAHLIFSVISLTRSWRVRWTGFRLS